VPVFFWCVGECLIGRHKERVAVTFVTTRLSPFNDEKTFSVYLSGEMEALGLVARPENSGR